MEVVFDDLGLNLVATRKTLLIGPSPKAKVLVSDELWVQLRKFKRPIIKLLRMRDYWDERK